MGKKHVGFVHSCWLLVGLLTVGQVSAQETNPQPKTPKPTAVPSSENMQKLDQSIQELNAQVGTLVKELKGFESGMSTVTMLLKLLVQEQRQATLEKQLDDVQTQLRALENRVNAIRARLQNLDRERVYTGSVFVTQDQARRQIREQLQRELEQIEAQRPEWLEREQALLDEVREIKHRLDLLKQRLEAIELKTEEETPIEPKPKPNDSHN
jgi:chromosome segregation ATPase